MILGIDASTAGSGGAKRHLIELLQTFRPENHGFSQIKVWGVEEVLAHIPASPFITKITHPYLNKGVIYRMVWQIFCRDRVLKNQVDILFSPFGTYTGKIRPYVTMSRNMLIFERNERKRFGLSLERLKFKLLGLVQKKSFANASGIIFLSQHARSMVGKTLNLSKIETKIIHHGVSNSFRRAPKIQQPLGYYNNDNPFTFLYVSTIWVYKHPWNIVAAVANLRSRNYPVALNIVGNNEQKYAGRKLQDAIDRHDPDQKFVNWLKNVNLNGVSEHYKQAEAFVFASTCENMPNILIEAMSSGLPIASSSHSPMPEFLLDAGLYFEPTNVKEIECVLEKLLIDHKQRNSLSSRSYEYSKRYSWDKCANETFLFLQRVAKESKKISNV